MGALVVGYHSREFDGDNSGCVTFLRKFLRNGYDNAFVTCIQLNNLSLHDIFLMIFLCVTSVAEGLDYSGGRLTIGGEDWT